MLQGADKEPPPSKWPSAGPAGRAAESNTETQLTGTHFCCRLAELVVAGSSCLEVALTRLAAAGRVRAVADGNAQHPVTCCRSAGRQHASTDGFVCLQVWQGQQLRAAMTRRTTTMRWGRTRIAMRTVSAGSPQGF